MTSEAQLSEWKRSWRKLLSESLVNAFAGIEEYLPEASPKMDSLLLLKAQFNEANREKLMGVKSGEDLQLDYNRIRLHLLEWIGALETTDFEVPAQGMKPKGNGTLLHKIPRQMAIGKEEVCIIRLAYDRAVIADNLELTEEVEVKEVKVSEVMEAELIDANSQPAFNIRTYHDERQFLEEGAYTEWKFYVDPVREGAFRLLIKLTVIEEVMGERERRNITWEEQVRIVAEAHEPVPAVFTVSGIALVTTAETTSGAAEPRSVLPGAPPSPAPTAGVDRKKVAISDKKIMPPTLEPPAPPAPPPQARNKSGLVRNLSIAASVALILGFGSTYLLFPDKHSEGSDIIEYPVEQPDNNKEEPSVVFPPANPGNTGDQTGSVDGSGNQAKPSAPNQLPEGVRFTGAIADRKLQSYQRVSGGAENGVLRLKLCVLPSGKVVDVRPASGGNILNRRLQADAVTVVRAWTFAPAETETCGIVELKLRAN